jgi:hypothetical protein
VKGAKVIGDKAEDIGEATVKGAKKAGSAVKDAVTKDEAEKASPKK